MSDDTETTGGRHAESVATAQALTSALQGVTNSIDALKDYGRRNRKFIRILGVLFALDVLLTAGFLWSLHTAQNAHDYARQIQAAQQQIRATQRTTCLQNNVVRATNIQLWDYILSIPATPSPTAKQKKTRSDFRAYVHRVYAPRDCGSA